MALVSMEVLETALLVLVMRGSDLHSLPISVRFNGGVGKMSSELKK